MIRFTVLLGMVLVAADSALSADVSETVTLYRNSLLDRDIRIHIATFDASEGRAYNSENFELAAELFEAQPDVRTRFWCEPGRYNPKWE